MYMKFELHLDEFEGPIDALLVLIEKRKLPINEISLADITDDYINFIRSYEGDSLSDTTHFIFVAATLTLIKSKSLLPSLDLTEEEKGDIDDLHRRLLLLQSYQEKGALLLARWGKRRMYFPKSARKAVAFRPHEGITHTALSSALSSLLLDQPELVSKKKEVTMKIAVHIEAMMRSLEERIQKELKSNFQSFVSDYTKEAKNQKEARVYLVVGFLAMLELVRNGVMQVIQEDSFASIDIEKV